MWRQKFLQQKSARCSVEEVKDGLEAEAGNGIYMIIYDYCGDEYSFTNKS